MSFSKEQLDEIENYYSQRRRDPGAPPITGLPYPEIVDDAPSTGGGQFSVQDLLTLLEYEETGQMPPTQPPPVEQKLGPELLPEGGFPAPGEQERQARPAQIGPPINLGSDEPIGPVAQRPEQEQQAPMPGAQFAAAGAPVGERPPGEFERFGPSGMPLQQEEEQLQQLLSGQSVGGQPGQHDIPLESEQTFQDVDTSRLQGTLDRQRNQVETLTDEEAPQNDKEPGFLGKALDILSRPNFAMAEGVSRSLEEDREGGGFLDQAKGFGSGLVEGFTGREKTTFADVLDESGVENKWAKGLGGFALDVALDPTTYVGGSIIKGATKSAAEGAGVRAAAKAAADPAVEKAARETVENRILKESSDALLTGKKGGGTKVSDQVLEKLIDKERKGLIGDAAKKATSEAQTPGAVGLSFGGKKLGQSEALYKGVSRAFKPIRELDTVQAMNKLFRPAAEFGDVHGIHRLHENVSTAHFEDSLKYFKEETAHLSKEQAELVPHLIEGTRYTDDPELLRIKKLAEDMNNNWFNDEVELGILTGDEFRPNYVRHVYKKGKETVDKYKGKTPDRKKGEPGFSKERDYPTLEQAKKDGMRPEEDIRNIMADRAAKHYQELAHHSFMNDAVDNFGIRAGTKEFDEVNGVLKGMGTQLRKVTLPGKKEAVAKEAYFPEPIADVLENLKTVKGDDLAAKTITRHFDKIHQETKFAMTVANPGHHVRNFYGNAFQAYQDGVRNPKRYAQALKAIRSDAAKSGSEAWQAGHKAKIKIGDGYSSHHELMDIYKLSGTKSGYVDVELGRTGTNKAKDFIRSVSTQREDTARLGHFLDVLKKEKPKGWNKMSMPEKVEFAKKTAAPRVQKFQFDYGDLTSFEKKYARKVAMFYTFMRKNTPLQLEMMALRPGKALNVKKANTAVEQMLGADLSEEFEDRIPEWVREMNIPLIQGDGEDQNPVYAGPNLPLSDLNRLGGPKHIAGEVIGALRPELKIPSEMAYEKQAFSGAPLPDGPQYAMQQLPITSLVKKYMDEDVTTGQANQSLASWLSGISMQEVTPQRQQSELRRQQQPVQEIIRDTRSKNLDEFQQEIEKARGRKK